MAGFADTQAEAEESLWADAKRIKTIDPRPMNWWILLTTPDERNHWNQRDYATNKKVTTRRMMMM